LVVAKELENALSLKHDVQSSVTGNAEIKSESSHKKQRKSKDKPKRKGKEKEGGKRFSHETLKPNCYPNQFEALGKEIKSIVENAPKDGVESNLLNFAQHFLSTAPLHERKRDGKRNEDSVAGPSSSVPRKIIINDGSNGKQDEVRAVEESQKDQEDEKSTNSSSCSSSKDSDDGDSMIERLQKSHEPIVSNWGQEDWEKVK